MDRRELIGGLVALGLALGGVANADDEQIPPTEREYHCEAVDAETGAPIPGVVIEGRERITHYNCARYENGQCQDCFGEDTVQTVRGTTNAEGRMEVIFLLPYCEPVSAEPPLWEKRIHLGWDDPVVINGGQDPDPWVLGRVEWVGEAELKHRVHLVRESRILDQFAPVLHRHRGRELQEGLADLVRSVDGPSRIDGYNVGGQRVVEETPPPLHVFDEHYWDSYGFGTQQIYLVLDFDDGILHAGAPPGERPLYAHAFHYEDGLVVQYWLWLQGNDLRQLPGGIGYHEGDWEYLSLYLEFESGEWVPKRVNLSQHSGGLSLTPEECWWSGSNAPTYEGLAQGYSPDRSHIHVWLAANSHALYNRFDPVYGLDVEIPPLCDISYSDRVDYNRSGISNGDHSFFEYDRIENMGEFSRTGQEHGEEYIWHWSGGPLEYLKFVGRFGEPHCMDIPDCADICGISGLSYTYRGPQSPLLESSIHHWDSFVFGPGRWGNSPQSFESISWGETYLLGDYLGEVATCEPGWGDVLRLEIPALYGDQSATARFTPVSGDVEVHEAGPHGEIPLGPPIDGAYLLELSRIGGEGEGRLDVETSLGHPLAVDLRFHVVPSECEDPAGIPGDDSGDVGVADDWGDAGEGSRADVAPVTLLGNPSRYGFHADLGAARHPWIAWTLHDLAGRRIADGQLDESVREIAWRSPASARLVPGRYFLRLRTADGATTSRTVVVVR